MAIHIRGRSRSKSSVSYKSNGSGSSHGYKSSREDNKLAAHAEDSKFTDLVSSGTKANPNAAITEDQPSTSAFQVSTSTALGSMPHYDRKGKLIEEPDLSNPTRYRWERPLDTIRSFQDAIDSEFKERVKTRRP